MSKLEHLKMIEKLENDDDYYIAEEIAHIQDNDEYIETIYHYDNKIKNYITDILVKETDSTFWSCKLAIIEKKQKQEKISSFNKDEQAIYFDLIQELKADIELLDRDISNYYYRLRAIQRQLKKINQFKS
tara:strand:- start:1858 stop:2247 length:390 start_codon:yes stop_codon:yes gene_type:complete